MIRRAARRPIGFSLISNSPIEDARLSWAARGLLVYLLSKPDHWEANINHLVTQGPMGRDGLYSLFNELKSLGYLTMVRPRDESGRTTKVSYLVDDTASGLASSGQSASSTSGFTTSGGASCGEARYIASTEEDSNTEEDSKTETTKQKPQNPQKQDAIASGAKAANGSKPTAATKFDPLAILLPQWLPPDIWQQWVNHRKEIKHPLTETACKQQIKQLTEWRAKGLDSIASITTAIRNSWQGLFEPGPKPTVDGQPVRRRELVC